MLFRTIIAAVAMALGLAGEAAAAPGQCFWRNGQPVGPVYRIENPNDNWLHWVQTRGGFCRPINEFERQGLERRPQAYPHEFSAGYRPPGYEPPPAGAPDEGWRGDPNRAAYLVSQWLAEQGRPYAQVRDTGRIEYIYDRPWRIFFARWADGARTRVAVRFSRREGGTYVAMQSYDRVTWTQPQPIGQ